MCGRFLSHKKQGMFPFEFVIDRDIAYLSLSIASMNHKNASYLAFDID